MLFGLQVVDLATEGFEVAELRELGVGWPYELCLTFFGVSARFDIALAKQKHCRLVVKNLWLFHDLHDDLCIVLNSKSLQGLRVLGVAVDFAEELSVEFLANSNALWRQMDVHVVNECLFKLG